MKQFAIFIYLLLFLSLVSCGVKKSMAHRPNIAGIESIDTLRIKHNDSLYTIGKNSLSKNKFGVWELYVEGDALERGLVTGSLTRELMHKQEDAIMDKIENLVPSSGYQNFLKKAVSVFNRKMYLHVPNEYQVEIYGISRFAQPRYDSYAPPFIRALYLHGAHDIGHALQDLMLVGCTSFAAWGDKTRDGQLLLGRNFDFYINDEFAEDKIAAFVHPDVGHQFMMYTWGGMIGVVSGMNVKGISVTINAGKTKIPFAAKTPISLVAREILQYAGTTAEAIEIAKKRQVFVSEAIMIGSAEEREAIVIEVAPGNFGVYRVQNSNKLICSNHFQSENYKNNRRNLKTIEEGHTQYRFDLMEQLLDQSESLTPLKAAGILRNTQGLEGVKIGLGNEKAINQLLAHHGVIFKPEEKKVWISTSPFQLGAFIAYDLTAAFSKFSKGNHGLSVAIPEETLPEDKFIHSPAYNNYQEFRTLYKQVSNAVAAGTVLAEDQLERLVQLNPHFWKSHALAGDYYYGQKDYKKAIISFKQALQREVTTLPEERRLEKRIIKSYKKI